MGIWVERDEKTKTVVLCTSDGKDCGAGVKPTRRIKLTPRNAAILGAKLITAADEDLTAFVEGSREVIETGTEGVKIAKSAVDLFKRASKLLGSD